MGFWDFIGLVYEAEGIGSGNGACGFAFRFVVLSGLSRRVIHGFPCTNMLQRAGIEYEEWKSAYDGAAAADLDGDRCLDLNFGLHTGNDQHHFNDRDSMFSKPSSTIKFDMHGISSLPCQYR